MPIQSRSADSPAGFEQISPHQSNYGNLILLDDEAVDEHPSYLDYPLAHNSCQKICVWIVLPLLARQCNAIKSQQTAGGSLDEGERVPSDQSNSFGRSMNRWV